MSVFKERILERRVAFVSGGTSGIGLGIARAFAEQGARVAVMSRNQDRVSAAITELERIGPSLGFAADVRDFGAVDAALRRTAESYGPVDIVVAGAAGNFLCAAAKLSANAFRTVVDIDLNGTFNVLRAAYEVVAKPGTSMITISAGQATQAHWGQAHACAAKAGVEMLTRALAAEWGPEGIRVNAIVPGPTDETEGMSRLAPTPEARRAIEERTPLRRYGTKHELGQVAVFLASEASAYITGAIVAADGGTALSGSRSAPPPGVASG